MTTLTLKRSQAEIDRLNDELDKAHIAFLDVIALPAFGTFPGDSITGRYLQTLMRINDPSQLEIFCNAKSARSEALHGMEALSQHAAALAQAMRLIMERAGEGNT
jgi:hypothetical protein